MDSDHVRLLLSAQAAPYLASIEFEDVDDLEWALPSDHSYLSDDERRDPDISASLTAMAATNELTLWFGRDMEGFLGLWLGPSSTSADVAPVVRLDSEGQYELIAASVPDYLQVTVDDEDFDALRSVLTGLGFAPRRSRDEIWEAIDGRDDPNAFGTHEPRRAAS